MSDSNLTEMDPYEDEVGDADLSKINLYEKTISRINTTNVNDNSQYIIKDIPVGGITNSQMSLLVQSNHLGLLPVGSVFKCTDSGIYTQGEFYRYLGNSWIEEPALKDIKQYDGSAFDPLNAGIESGVYRCPNLTALYIVEDGVEVDFEEVYNGGLLILDTFMEQSFYTYIEPANITWTGYSLDGMNVTVYSQVCQDLDIQSFINNHNNNYRSDVTINEVLAKNMIDKIQEDITVTETGSGNAVTTISYTSNNKTITATKGETFVKTSDVDNSLNVSSTNPVQNKVIAELVPAQATSSNQLADKNFVNSSVATATATFRGTYNLITDLNLTTSATQSNIAAAIVTKLAALSIIPDNNDYVFILIPVDDTQTTLISHVDRYKFDGTSWSYEYTLNNSSFTAAQWDAINSGVTSTSFNNKLDKVTSTNNRTRVYTITPEGTQSTLPVSALVAADYIVQRNINGHIKVNDTPTSNDDAVSKLYADTKVAQVSTTGAPNYHGMVYGIDTSGNQTMIPLSTSDIAGDAIPRYDSGSKLYVYQVSGNNQYQVTNKGYVDGNFLALSTDAIQTVRRTTGTTVTAFQSSASNSSIGFKNSGGTFLGYYGVNSSEKPVFYSGSNSGIENELALAANFLPLTQIGIARLDG